MEVLEVLQFEDDKTNVFTRATAVRTYVLQLRFGADGHSRCCYFYLDTIRSLLTAVVQYLNEAHFQRQPMCIKIHTHTAVIAGLYAVPKICKRF